MMVMMIHDISLHEAISIQKSGGDGGNERIFSFFGFLLLFGFLRKFLSHRVLVNSSRTIKMKVKMHEVRGFD